MEQKIIGQRVFPKMQFFLVTIVSLLIVSCLILISFIIAGEMPAVVLWFMVPIAIMGILEFTYIIVKHKRRKNIKDKPTVVLLNNKQLRLYLLNGKEQIINIENIKKVGFILRQTGKYYVLYVQYKSHSDGKLIFLMNDNKRIVVDDVANVKNVANEILDMKNKI